MATGKAVAAAHAKRSPSRRTGVEAPGEKLIIKLWETLIDKGIGSLLRPWQIKRDGRARSEVRREELLMLAQAESEVADIRAGRKRLDLASSVPLISGPTRASYCVC